MVVDDVVKGKRRRRIDRASRAHADLGGPQKVFARTDLQKMRLVLNISWGAELAYVKASHFVYGGVHAQPREPVRECVGRRPGRELVQGIEPSDAQRRDIVAVTRGHWKRRTIREVRHLVSVRDVCSAVLVPPATREGARRGQSGSRVSREPRRRQCYTEGGS